MTPLDPAPTARDARLGVRLPEAHNSLLNYPTCLRAATTAAHFVASTPRSYG